MTRAAVLMLLLAMAKPAPAHEKWANGDPIPAWVSSQCCGPADAHQLDMSQVSEVAGGWRIDGLDSLVTPEHVFASQDGEVWAFYTPNYPDATVWCLFLPLAF